MPIPAGHKTYKRKIGDPKGKIYSDKGTYGDERDDLWARGKSHTSDEAHLFDMFCTKCQRDHLSMFCPVGRTIKDRRRGYPRISSSEIKKVLNKECNMCGQPNGMHHRECPLKKYTGCWCCGDNTIKKKDCPRVGIQRELEKARRSSEELHAELFYNQGGANRISKLTKQQKKDIQKQQPIPQPESSVKEPFEDVKRRKIEDEEIFKKPKDGVRPPQKAVPKENKVQEWIEEQRKAKYQPEPVTERYDFLVCDKIRRPCYIGLDFLRKHKVGIEWSSTGKLELQVRNKPLIESTDTHIRGPKIFPRSDTQVPPRS